MAFIGEAKHDWSDYFRDHLCLNKSESKILLPLIRAELKRLRPKIEKLESLHEVGELTSRQQTLYSQYEDKEVWLESMEQTIKAYIKEK